MLSNRGSVFSPALHSDAKIHCHNSKNYKTCFNGYICITIWNSKPNKSYENCHRIKVKGTHAHEVNVTCLQGSLAYLTNGHMSECNRRRESQALSVAHAMRHTVLSLTYFSIQKPCQTQECRCVITRNISFHLANQAQRVDEEKFLLERLPDEDLSWALQPHVHAPWPREALSPGTESVHVRDSHGHF